MFLGRWCGVCVTWVPKGVPVYSGMDSMSDRPVRERVRSTGGNSRSCVVDTRVVKEERVTKETSPGTV